MSISTIKYVEYGGKSALLVSGTFPDISQLSNHYYSNYRNTYFSQWTPKTYVLKSTNLKIIGPKSHQRTNSTTTPLPLCDFPFKVSSFWRLAWGYHRIFYFRKFVTNRNYWKMDIKALVFTQLAFPSLFIYCQFYSCFDCCNTSLYDI